MFVSRSYKRSMLFILAIPLVYLLIWRLYPIFHSMYLSLTKYNMIWDDYPEFVGVANYLHILTDKHLLASIKMTLYFAFIAVAWEFLLGLGLALILDNTFRGKNFILGVLLMPMILTPAVVGVVWYILYNDKIGPINYFLNLIGLPSLGWLSDKSIALRSIIITDVWQWTPFLFLLFTCTLQTIPLELYEAAKVDGARWLETLRYIKIPLLARISIVAVLLRFMDAFREFDKVFVMTAGGPGRATELATIFVYKSVFQYFDIGYGAAFAITLLLIVSVLYSVSLKFLRMV